MAIRGHKEIDSNFLQLLLLDCPELNTWLKNQQYMSPEIVNELIGLMGNSVLRKLLRSVVWFAILADETADFANNEQLSISIRWVDRSYNIHEDFIGVVHVHS